MDVELSYASVRESSIDVRIALSEALAHRKTRKSVAKVIESLADAVRACEANDDGWVVVTASPPPTAGGAAAAAVAEGGGTGEDQAAGGSRSQDSNDVSYKYLAGAAAKLDALIATYPLECKGWLAAALVADVGGLELQDTRSAPRVESLTHSVQRTDDAASFGVTLTLPAGDDGSEATSRVFRLKLALTELPAGARGLRWAAPTEALPSEEGGFAEGKAAHSNVPFLTLGMTDSDAAATLDATLAEALDARLGREVLVSELGCLDELLLEVELARVVGVVYDRQVARAKVRAARVVGSGLKSEDTLIAHMQENLKAAKAGALWDGASLPQPAGGQGAHFVMTVISKSKNLPNRGAQHREARRSVAMQADEAYKLGQDVVGGPASKYIFFTVNYTQMVGMRVMSRPTKDTVLTLMQNDIRNYERKFTPMELLGGSKATWLVPGPSNVLQLRGQPTILVAMERGKDQLAMRKAMQQMGVIFYIARSARGYTKVSKAYPLRGTAGGTSAVIVFKPTDYAVLAKFALSPQYGVASISMVEPPHMPVDGGELFYWRSAEGAKREQRVAGGIDLSVYGVASAVMDDDAFYAELKPLGTWTARDKGLVTFEPGDVNVDGAGGRGKLVFHGVSPERLVKVVDFFNDIKSNSAIMDNGRTSLLIIGQEMDIQEVLAEACGYCLHLGHATGDCPVRRGGDPGVCPRCFEVRVVPTGALAKFCAAYCRPPTRAVRDRAKAQRRSRILGEIRRGLVAAIYIKKTGVPQMPSTRPATIMDKSGALVQIAVVERAEKLNKELQLAAEKVRHHQRQDERDLMSAKMVNMSEEGMHLWQVVQQQAAAMGGAALGSMQKHLLALRACHLTGNVSQEAVQIVLDLILMLHKDEEGRCSRMIDTIGTPRLRDMGHSGATPGMQAVTVSARAAAPTVKRGLTNQMDKEEGHRRKAARGANGSRNSMTPQPPSGGGAP